MQLLMIVQQLRPLGFKKDLFALKISQDNPGPKTYEGNDPVCTEAWNLCTTD